MCLSKAHTDKIFSLCDALKQRCHSSLTDASHMRKAQLGSGVDALALEFKIILAQSIVKEEGSIERN